MMMMMMICRRGGQINKFCVANIVEIDQHMWTLQ